MTKSEIVDLLAEFGKEFDIALRKIKCLYEGNGDCIVSFKLCQPGNQLWDWFRKGFPVKLVEMLSSYALFTHAKGARPSISLNLNMTYPSPSNDISLSKELIIYARTLMADKYTAKLLVEICSKTDNNIIVKGEHTKYFLTNCLVY